MCIVHPLLARLKRGACRSTSSDDLHGEGGSTYVPLAEQIRKLNEQGPRAKAGEKAAMQPYEKPAVTVPKTPEFSSFRRKTASARGFSDSETEQLEEMKKHQFKARPVMHFVYRGHDPLTITTARA